MNREHHFTNWSRVVCSLIVMIIMCGIWLPALAVNSASYHGGIEYWIHYHNRNRAGYSAEAGGLLPPYIWAAGCCPTATAMVLGYWDNHGTWDNTAYGGDSGTGKFADWGDLIRFYQDSRYIESIPAAGGGGNYTTRWNHVYSPDLLVDLANAMKTNAAGSTYNINFESGVNQVTSGKGYGSNWPNYYATIPIIYPTRWTKIKEEINNNRPCMWLMKHYEDGHCVTVWGYVEGGTYDKYVILYNTWDELKREWPIDSDWTKSYGVLAITPQSGIGNQDIFYHSPQSGSYSGGSTMAIWWYQYGAATDNVWLQYSTNGGCSGCSWSTIVSSLSSSQNWNSYSWRIPTTIDSSRVKIRIIAYQGYTRLASDGNMTNLSITPPPPPINYTLSVKSLGASGVSISSSTGHGGTTNYTRTVASGTTVRLTAPATVGATMEFTGWTGAVTSNNQTIEFSMTEPRTVTANYQMQMIYYTLNVNSSGASGVVISSTTGHGGTTNYMRTVASGTTVRLTAPATVGEMKFTTWDWEIRTSGQTIEFSMTRPRTVTANYQPTTLTISGNVRTSTGVVLEGVLINGLLGNPQTYPSGNYSALVDYGWSGTATPIKAGYTFSPSNRSYSNVTSNQLNQDYISDKKVPDEYLTIQEAIDSASDGDVISVAAGTYVENINFYGKDIVVQSQDGPLLTIITSAGAGPIVWFHNGETASAKLIGFTLKNSEWGIAGPVLNFGYRSHPTIENCIITDNPGGIYYYYSGAVLKNCLIFGNTTNLLFKFDANDFHPEMINCTIADNNDAFLSNPYSAVKFKNCIIYGNEISGVSGNFDISYSLIEGGYSGTGNIDADPLFVDALNGDYHLQANSLAIDTGTDFGVPSSDIDGMSRPRGAGHDMGAYEGYLPVVLIPYTPDPTNDNTPTLDWNDVAGANTYILQYSDQSDFSTYTEMTNITESTYEITDVLSDGTWYWRVRALDSEGVAGWWTATDDFMVDTVSPMVSSTSPTDSAIGIAVDTTISATFSESMDSITITTDTFTVSTDGSNISGSVSYSDKTAIFTPSNNLAKGTTYTAIITTGVKDIAGNSMASNYSWSFTTLIPTYVLTISANTGGTTDPAPGTYTYDEGTEVTITPIADTGYRFSGWTGDVPFEYENDNPLSITIDSNKSVTANFIRQYTLTIAAGANGTTSPSPGSYDYDDEGTQVSVRAIPNSGYKFSGWSGDASGTTNPITLTMDSDKSVRANFEKKGRCFIATAAYGSPLHPHVDVLRDFRDKYLMPSKLGRALVDIYYKYSPSVANFIMKHKVLKAAVRFSLMPVIVFSYSMLHFGLIITIVMLVLVSMFPIFLISFFWRRKRRLEAKDLKSRPPDSEIDS